jgi:DinB superfamily
MSVFTNPASRSIDQARDYTAAILNLLGSRDPMDVLSRTDQAIRAAIAGMSDAQLSQPESAGKWSVRQVVQHFADSDLVWGYRVRMVLAQDRPPLTGYDQDLWAQRLHYERGPIDEALDLFSVLRRSNLGLLTNASADDLRRVGVHAERGEESVEHMVRMYGGHDLLHLRQLARIRQAVEQGA